MRSHGRRSRGGEWSRKLERPPARRAPAPPARGPPAAEWGPRAGRPARAARAPVARAPALPAPEPPAPAPPAAPTPTGPAGPEAVMGPPAAEPAPRRCPRRARPRACRAERHLPARLAEAAASTSSAVFADVNPRGGGSSRVPGGPVAPQSPLCASSDVATLGAMYVPPPTTVSIAARRSAGDCSLRT